MNDQPEQIINPAPAEEPIHIPVQPIRLSPQPSDSPDRSHDRTMPSFSCSGTSAYQIHKIRDLREKLRIISDVTQPLNQYMDFQQRMDPKLRIIVNVNQLLIMLLGAKSFVSGDVKRTYNDIDNPPEDLSLEKDRILSDLDEAVDVFTESLSQIVIMLQSQLSQSPVHS